jgi:hypothetical protein
MKIQITNPKLQTNSNDQNSNFQTYNTQRFAADHHIPGGHKIQMRYSTTAVRVLVIGY